MFLIVIKFYLNLVFDFLLINLFIFDLFSVDVLETYILFLAMMNYFPAMYIGALKRDILIDAISKIKENI